MEILESDLTLDIYTAARHETRWYTPKHVGVSLYHKPTGFAVKSDIHNSAQQNRAACVAALRQFLDEHPHLEQVAQNSSLPPAVLQALNNVKDAVLDPVGFFVSSWDYEIILAHIAKLNVELDIYRKYDRSGCYKNRGANDD